MDVIYIINTNVKRKTRYKQNMENVLYDVTIKTNDIVKFKTFLLSFLIFFVKNKCLKKQVHLHDIYFYYKKKNGSVCAISCSFY